MKNDCLISLMWKITRKMARSNEFISILQIHNHNYKIIDSGPPVSYNSLAIAGNFGWS